MNNQKLRIVTTGGTIFQREKAGKMEISVAPEDVTSQSEVDAEISIVEVGKRTGAEMTFSTLARIRDAILEQPCDGAVVITGTDSLEEVAFALDLIYEGDAPVTICGAMKPNDVLGYDGIANFNDAAKVALSKEARGAGVLVVMNDQIHPARYVRKYDSALIGSFRSHPGPMGEIRRGRPIFYYRSLPPMEERFGAVDVETADSLAVPIWTMAISTASLPETFLETCDGLVIAGMGTGSISQGMVDQLADTWTKRIPIILATRCWAGLSFDDYYYRGSLTKYEEKGFRILDYHTLNPLQARIKLILELAS